MAESDRPTPESTPHDSETEDEATLERDALEEPVLADGTLVSEASIGPSSAEIDELLDVFKDELEQVSDLSEGGVYSEDEEEDLLMQAEALLGTSDPRELETLANIHLAEASEQVERLERAKGEVHARETDAGDVEAAPAEAAGEAPGAPTAGPITDEDVEAARVAVGEALGQGPPATGAPEDFDAVIAEAEAAELARVEGAPSSAAAPAADVDAILAEAAGEPAVAPAAPEPEPAPEPPPVAEASPPAPDVHAREAQLAAFAAAEIGTKGGALAEPAVPAPPALSRRLVRRAVRRGRRAGARVTALPPFANLGPRASAFAVRSLQSKGRLAAVAGLSAALAAWAGFSLFEARFSEQVLRRRFPHASTPEELLYYEARAEIAEGRYARAKQHLRAVRAEPGSVPEADVLLALGEAYFLDDSIPHNFRYVEARRYYEAAIAADPEHPQVVDARRRIAESYRAQGLWAEAARAYDLLLERYRRALDPAPIRYALGEVRLAAGEPAAAADAFERVWNESPLSPLAPEAKVRQGDVLLALGRSEDARALWTELTASRVPAAARWAAVARLADLAEGEGKTQAAARYVERWLRGAPEADGHARMLLHYARLAARLDDPTGAAAALDQAIDLDPEPDVLVEASLRRGALYRAAGDADAAKALYVDALRAAPDAPRLLAALRDTYLAEGNVAPGLDYARRAAAAAPDDAGAQLALARAYRTADRGAKAMAVYWDMVAHHPLARETQTAVRELTALLHGEGLTEEAYKLLDRYAALTDTPEGKATTFEAKADLLIAMGLHEPAAKALRAAVEANPTDRLRLRLADELRRQRDWAGVLETLAPVGTAEETPGAYARTATLRAEALLNTGRAADALPVLTEAAGRLDPTPLRVDGLRAEVYMALGETVEARGRLEALERRLGDGAPIPEALVPTYLAWGQHLYDQGIYSRAAEVYARLTGDTVSDHDRAWAAYQVGNCYTALQDYARAAEAYATMIDTHPNAPWVPFAQEKAQFAQLQVDRPRRAGRT